MNTRSFINFIIYERTLICQPQLLNDCYHQKTNRLFDKKPKTHKLNYYVFLVLFEYSSLSLYILLSKHLYELLYKSKNNKYFNLSYYKIRLFINKHLSLIVFFNKLFCIFLLNKRFTHLSLIHQHERTEENHWRRNRVKRFDVNYGSLVL